MCYTKCALYQMYAKLRFNLQRQIANLSVNQENVRYTGVCAISRGRYIEVLLYLLKKLSNTIIYNCSNTLSRNCLYLRSRSRWFFYWLQQKWPAAPLPDQLWLHSPVCSLHCQECCFKLAVT